LFLFIQTRTYFKQKRYIFAVPLTLLVKLIAAS